MSAQSMTLDQPLHDVMRACGPGAPGIDRLGAVEGGWEAAARTAMSLGFAEPLALNAEARGIALPPAVRTGLRDRLLSTSAGNLAHARQAATAIAACEARGIPVLTFKGPALAVQAMRHLGARHFFDLDLLVPRARFRDARLALADAGYALDRSEERLATVLPIAARVSVLRPPGATLLPLEVHGRIAGWPMHVRLDGGELVGRAVTVDAGGLPLRTLAPEDHLLALCAHAATHRWSFARHIVEIAWMASRDLRWDDLLRRAERAHLAGETKVGILLARELCGVDPPPEAIAWARTGSGPRAASDVAARLPGSATPVDRWEDLRQHIACREGRMDKVRYFLRSELQSWLVKLPWERWL